MQVLGLVEPAGHGQRGKSEASELIKRGLRVNLYKVFDEARATCSFLEIYIQKICTEFIFLGKFNLDIL